MTERVEVVVIGGGQAGLSASYHLSRQGRDHVVLEKERIGEAWRTRWDSFTLVTPNWTYKLPGFEYNGASPDGFMPRDEIVSRLESYAERIKAPVRTGVRVTSIEPTGGGGYQIETDKGDWKADNVIVATGLFQSPKLPAASADFPPAILQIHSGHYRNPGQLPSGAVLVVGSGQSGCQIVEELYKSGRKVYLTVGKAGRAPRRYRGKDCFWWLIHAGMFERTVDKLPSPKVKFAANPHLSGKDGGHSLNLHQFARDGVTLLGRLEGVEGDRLVLAPDLRDSMAKADEFALEIIKAIDGAIAEMGLPVPEDPQVKEVELAQPEVAEGPSKLSLEESGIKTVIWATGYGFDFSLVRLPVFDDDGFPITQRGVTEYPGLYFLGMPWLHTQKSGLLLGVGEDASHVAEHIATRSS
jgi:putative flavoprotein involved in K+ transport